MKGLLAVVLLLAGCPAAPVENDTTPHHPRWRPDSGPIAGFDQADLVAFDDGHAIFYSLAGDQIKEVGRADIGHSGVDVAEWANHDTLYVNGIDREVLRLTKSGVTEIPVPALTEYTFRPGDDTGEDANWEELGVDERGAWYGYCPYAVYGENDYVCQRWGWIGIDGAAKGKKEAGGEHAERHYDWPQIEGETCTLDTGGSGYQAVGSHWVTGDTILVEYGYGEGAYRQVVQWELHQGCDGKTLYSGLTATPGPNGLWIGRQGEYDEVAHDFVFRGAKRIGIVKGTNVRFRP
jgi:hypothetical protein